MKWVSAAAKPRSLVGLPSEGFDDQLSDTSDGRALPACTGRTNV
jgi:hypothetical protein